MTNTATTLFAIACLALLCACPGTRDPSNRDGAVTGGDTLGAADGAGVKADAGKLGCNNDCTDFVFDRLLLPTSSADATKYGLQVDGKSHNALGSIISLLAQYGSSASLQESLDKSVYKGDALALLRLRAKSFTDEPQVRAQTWGGSATCCTDTSTVAKCKAEALTTCFNGKAVVKKSGNSPDNMLFDGAITGGAMKLSAKTMTLTMKLSNTSNPLTLSLKHASLSGKVSASKIVDGVLAGAIPKSDVDKILVPELASLLDALYKDTKTDAKTKAMIKQLADTNGDGTISTSEVANNSLLKTFLAGDVDVDKDGEKELSIGLGFSAVTCEISDLKGV